jgi:ketosteroid isomerase-like protein
MKPRPAACGALLAATLLALVAGGCGVDHTSKGEAAQSTAAVVRDVERQRLRALLNHDLDTAEKLHAADFELINPLGETQSKEAYIDSGAAFAYTIWKPISPIRVRVHGDSAVIRYESDLEIHGSRGHYWHTDLYEKNDGRWQIVWSQATAAP